MKKIYILFITSFILHQNLNSQVGCPSNLSTPIINGPDSLNTDGDQTFRSLEVDANNPNIVYIGTEGNGIFKSTDGGTNWQWLRNGFRVNWQAYAETWDIALDPNDPQKIYTATTDSPGPIQGNYPSAMAGIYYSADAGQTWNQRNCGFPNSKGNAIWIDPNNSNRLIASIQGGTPSFTNPPQNFYAGGIFISTDGALNWSPATFPNTFNNQTLARLLQKGDTIITCGLGESAPESKGILFSVDRGLNWSTLSNNSFSGQHIFHYGIGPNAKKLYLTTMNGHSLNEVDIINETLNSVDLGNGNYLGIIKPHPINANQIYFATGGGSQLFRTINGLGNGDVFNQNEYQFIQDFGKVIENIVFSPSDPNIVYLATRGYRVYKSTDGGNTFSLLVKLRDVIKTANIEESTHSSITFTPIFSENEIFCDVNEIVNFEIISITGNKIKTGKIAPDNETINTTLLDSGVYFFNLESNGLKKSVKFIKK